MFTDMELAHSSTRRMSRCRYQPRGVARIDRHDDGAREARVRPGHENLRVVLRQSDLYAITLQATSRAPRVRSLLSRIASVPEFWIGSAERCAISADEVSRFAKPPTRTLPAVTMNSGGVESMPMGTSIAGDMQERRRIANLAHEHCSHVSSHGPTRKSNRERGDPHQGPSHSRPTNELFAELADRVTTSATLRLGLMGAAHSPTGSPDISATSMTYSRDTGRPHGRRRHFSATH